MSRSIRLHPKYGINPTIPTCFFCGEQKNEIILMGAAYKGEAPMSIGCVDREPCDKCANLMEKGVMLISVQDNTDHENPYRTGKIVVITFEAAARLFPTLGKSRMAFVEDSMWKKIGLPE
jgi:hypothetical protein